MEDVVVVPPTEHDHSSPIKEWRLALQAGTLTRNDFIDYFKKLAPKFFEVHNEMETGESL